MDIATFYILYGVILAVIIPTLYDYLEGQGIEASVPKVKPSMIGIGVSIISTLALLFLFQGKILGLILYETVSILVIVVSIIIIVVMERFTENVVTYILSIIVGIPVGYLLYIFLWFTGIIA